MIMLSNPILKVDQLTKKYHGITVIDDVSFSVEKGEVVGLLGPNGAGKSTALNIIVGLLDATSGNVEVCGNSVAYDSHLIRKHIGFMPEKNPLPEKLRVGEFLRLRATLKGIPKKLVRLHVEKLMRMTDIFRKARYRIIGTLSKGYRQRIGITDAFLGDPDLILLDEPTIGLDPHQMIIFRDLIETFRGKKTMLISSHILSEIDALCDRIIIINHGNLVANGSISELRNRFIRHRSMEVKVLCDISIIDKFKHSVHGCVFSEINSDIDLNIHEFSIIIDGDAEPLDIREKIVRYTEWKLLEMVEKKLSLEEIFLMATERCWDNQNLL
ncbi:MAG: ABC transporter ATP-binding protein [Puniceicoccales bacterium]|jgi:ABC-2 type transport system ATP-binding protein|nr:ABC transporter ATP-binding protein [Puniceicoccales bacterium]